MRISRTFEYENQKHSLSFCDTIKGQWFELDNVRCNDKITGFSRMGIGRYESSIVLNEDLLIVVAYKKQMYILKNGLDIETAVQYTDSKKRVWSRDIISFINFLPMVYLLYELYKNNKANLEKIAESRVNLIIGCGFIAILFVNNMCCATWCSYSLYHPIMQKNKKIGIAVGILFLGFLISMGLFVIARCRGLL